MYRKFAVSSIYCKQVNTLLAKKRHGNNIGRQRRNWMNFTRETEIFYGEASESKASNVLRDIDNIQNADDSFESSSLKIFL